MIGADVVQQTSCQDELLNWTHGSLVPQKSLKIVLRTLRLPGTYAAKIDENQTPLCTFPLIILLLDHIEGNVQKGSNFKA